jgi:hypothetical protein
MEQDIKSLERLIGEWTIEMVHPALPPSDTRGRVTFEWMVGEKFIVQRWEVPVPEAPDGLAIIAPDERGDGFLQHYFDSRGVQRVYQLRIDGDTWAMERDEPGFAQRWTSTFSDDGATIEGAWSMCTDGTTWEHDFDLVYRRVS